MNSLTTNLNIFIRHKPKCACVAIRKEALKVKQQNRKLFKQAQIVWHLRGCSHMLVIKLCYILLPVLLRKKQWFWKIEYIDIFIFYVNVYNKDNKKRRHICHTMAITGKLAYGACWKRFFTTVTLCCRRLLHFCIICVLATYFFILFFSTLFYFAVEMTRKFVEKMENNTSFVLLETPGLLTDKKVTL